MNNEFVYEPIDEANYQRTVTSLEREIDRLKSELLPSPASSVIERDKQQTIWLELDRVTRYLAHLRDKEINIIHVR
jgi:phytoene dehydrogenase-like protein